MTPQITVSIVSYNTRELLRECLAALETARGELNLQIIVADNASRDGSTQMVRSEFPRVEILETGANLGYGAANNRAFERARGRYFCALNSDAFVEAETLKILLEWMEAHPEAGACVPQLLWPDGTPQVAAGDDPSLFALFLQQTLLEEATAVAKKLASLLVPKRGAAAEDDENAREVEQLNGACLFCRREAYDAVGGFDASYWMYGEDVDLSVRLRESGWKLFLVPGARVTHHLGASSRDWRARAKMIVQYNRSRLTYFQRRGGARASFAAKVLVVGGALLRLTLWSLLPRQSDKIRLFRQVLRQTYRA